MSTIDSREVYDLIVVGSGPAASIAALNAATRGLSVKILERGSTSLSGNWFSKERVSRNLEHAGLFTPALYKSSALGLPSVLGGGFAANSGLYHWPSTPTLDTWSTYIDLKELESSRKKVESKLKLIPAPVNLSSDLLASTATTLGLDSVPSQTWQIDSFSAVGPFLAEALSLGATLELGIDVSKIIKNKGLYEIVSRSPKSFFARSVLLAAGALGSYKIALNSGLIDKDSFLDAHPMIKSVLFPKESLSSPPSGEIGSTQVLHQDLIRSGCALGTKWMLSANHPEVYDKIQNGFLNNQAPISWYTQANIHKAFKLSSSSQKIYQLFDKKTKLIQDSIKEHLSLLQASGLEWSLSGTPNQPKLLKNSATLKISPRFSVVHFSSSMPLGRLVDDCGRFFSDSKIGVCCSAILPSSPGVNPQASTMAIADLVSRKFLSSLKEGFSGGYL